MKWNSGSGKTPLVKANDLLRMELKIITSCKMIKLFKIDISLSLVYVIHVLNR